MIKRQIVAKLEQFNLGLTRQTVGFTEYQACWRQAYEFISHFVRLSVSNISLDHVGSTAVPGIVAKPILDVLLVYKNEHDFRAQTYKLIDLGFTDRSDRFQKPGRYLFCLYNEQKAIDNAIDYVHLHGLREGDPEIGRMLTFR